MKDTAEPQELKRDEAQEFWNKIAEGLALQRRAGRVDQFERAKQGIPPRAVLRAAGNVRKRGRKGAKARARITRLAVDKQIELRFKG